MPRAKEKSSVGLSIELLDDRPFYTPGSKVSGNVTLTTVEDFSIGSVNIEFYGRLKVFFVYSHGQGESHHRGRAPLFSDKQFLYEGYHTHKPGSFSWPFVFEIPNNPDVAAVHESKHQWNERDHFLSTTEYIPNHPMPPTFKMRKHGFGYRYRAFIEYVIKVEVKEAQGARMILPPASRKAILPITVKQIAVPDSNTFSLPPSVQFTIPGQLMEKTTNSQQHSPKTAFQTQTCRCTVKSSRLSNGNRARGTSGSLFSVSDSIRERTRSMLNSSSTPRYTFDIRVSVPERVRILEERAIPILVDAMSVRQDELTTISPENYPDICIDNITLELGVSTHIRFKSIFPTYKETRYDVKLLDRHPVDHIIDTNASERRSSQRLGDDENNDPSLKERGFDLSTLPGISLALVSAKMGKQIEKPLTPSFNSYIIAREYTLNWKFELDVAGEKVKASSDAKIPIPIQVLPPEGKELESLMQEMYGTQKSGIVDRDDDENDNDDDDNSDDESTESKDTTKDAKSLLLLKKFKSRRTKQQEAAEEAAAARAQEQYEPPPPNPFANPFTNDSSTSATNIGNTSAGGGSGSGSSAPPFQYQPPETLPSYQRNPTDFGYRHEIDENRDRDRDRPPRYEAE